jgi:hypothetical protein
VATPTYPADIALIFPSRKTGKPRKYHIPEQPPISAEALLAESKWQRVSWRRGTKGRLTCLFTARFWRRDRPNAHSRPRSLKAWRKGPLQRYPESASILDPLDPCATRRGVLSITGSTRLSFSIFFSRFSFSTFTRVCVADSHKHRMLNNLMQCMPGDEVWLVGERRSTGKQKYYVSNLPADATIKTLAATIKAGWVCEQASKVDPGRDCIDTR